MINNAELRPIRLGLALQCLDFEFADYLLTTCCAMGALFDQFVSPALDAVQLSPPSVLLNTPPPYVPA